MNRDDYLLNIDRYLSNPKCYYHFVTFELCFAVSLAREITFRKVIVHFQADIGQFHKVIVIS
ncbi:hypothetical protein MHZ92_05595 [Sporosarcina sp. ACRSL]|uniref:hypothetical protein n=1 Tax=Sporosarcina sp. ACRSL TaxID=2918215 RepID=UPI001EF4B01B|nr:hypothetical protein [Sporosarcina sp. ACRSL]MCG7343595.1 hypothetical protein [Sporosarcina sp. ACRSL]